MVEEIGGYRIVRRIGSGGMGVVYEAVDGDGVPVALKLLHPHISHDPAARARLAREVELLHRVRGRGVARVLDAEVEESDAFVVTELVAGPTLEQDVARDGPFTKEELAGLASGLADALHAIHRVGVVHRDLKPGNVMLSPAGPVLIDFGIAQIAGDTRLTETGMVTGTIGYIDPEVVDGAAPSPVGDWWAWAAVLVFAATGRRPFGGGPAASVIKRMTTAQVDLAGVEDRLLGAALWAALQPDHSRRLDSNAVQAVLEGRWDETDLRHALTALGLAWPAERIGDTVEVAPELPPSYAPEGGPAATTADPGTAAAWAPVPATRPIPATAVSEPPAAPAPTAYPAAPAAGYWPPPSPYPGGAPVEATPAWLRPAPARPGTVAGFAFLLVAAAGMWPGVAAIAFAALLLLTGTVGYASRARRSARLRYGLRRGDTARTVAATPVHLGRAVVVGGLLLLPGALLGWVAHAAADLLLADKVLGSAAGARATILLWVAFAVAFAVTWACLPAMREGARTAVAVSLPVAGMRLAVILLCVALGVAFIAMAVSGGLGPPVWSPLPAPPGQ